MISRRTLNRMIMLGVLGVISLVAACSPVPTTPAPDANLPNPASVHCEEKGGRLEMRQDPSGGTVGYCIFPDGGECEEWAYFRGECEPISPTGEAAGPTSIATALPIDPADYQGWWTYLHPTYNFSIMLPEDWIVEEVTSSDQLLSGHQLNLRSRYELEGQNIRLTFRRSGEDILLWPTGVGEGEFIQEGTLEISGKNVKRMLLVCPSGEISSIWYHQDDSTAAIMLGEIEFGVIFSASSSHCSAGKSLDGKTQRVGEMIISSLKIQ